MNKKTDKDLENENALEALIELEQSGKIDRREFLNLSSMISGGLLFSELFRSQSAFAWIATRMRKGRGSSTYIDVGDIGHSLRLRSSASGYLSRVFSTPTNNKIYSYSVWVKRGSANPSGHHGLLERYVDPSNSTSLRISGDTIGFQYYVNGSYNLTWTTTGVFRDSSAFYHILLVVDTTQVSSANAVKIYVNGVQQVAPFTPSVGSYVQNANYHINAASTHLIGVYAGVYYSDNNLSRIAFVDGLALTPSSFGYLNINSNSWVTKSQSEVKAVVDAGGVNSFMLDFDDGSTLVNLAKDKSVKANNWTCNNISITAGHTYDWMTDTPSNNFCTINNLTGILPSSGSYLVPVYSDANLKIAPGGAEGSNLTTAVGTMSFPSSGKFYWEVTLNTVASLAASRSGIGIISANALKNNGGDMYYSTVVGCYAYTGNGVLYQSPNTQFGSNAAWVAGDVIGCAFDIDAGTLKFYRNGVLQPSSYSGIPISGETYFPGAGYWIGASFNFGQRPFFYTQPTGFKTLCTTNLAAPIIANPKKYFDITLLTGNGAGSRTFTQAIAFDPDLVWMKNRSVSYRHQIYDRTRGFGLNKELTSDNNTLEGGANGFINGYLSSATSNSLTTIAGTNDNILWNENTRNMVVWEWKAGGNTVTNNAGSITSQVSANPSSGFSIVTYTGTGTAGTIGHSLSSTPALIIVKNRTGASDHWPVWHKNLTNASYALRLNLDTAQATSGGTGWWNNNLPTSSVFSIGPFSSGSSETNTSGNNYIAYCFTEVSGFSKFGSYKGNGSTDGPFINCDFRPRWIMIKRTDSAANWRILDTARDAFNPVKFELYPNLSNLESSFTALDCTSNGFKIRNTDATYNSSGGTYVFIAFAEAPFKYANGR